MARHVIYKHTFSESMELKIPASSIVRHVGVQGSSTPLPALWIEHSDMLPKEPLLTYILFATGTHWESAEAWEYVGTAVCADGKLVWHVMRKLT
jgi:hypothetical protein